MYWNSRRLRRGRWRTGRRGWFRLHEGERRLRWRRQASRAASTSCRVMGQEDADGELAVVGGVGGGVEGAGAHVEMDFAFDGCAQAGFELAVGVEALVVERRLLADDGEG